MKENRIGFTKRLRNVLLETSQLEFVLKDRFHLVAEGGHVKMQARLLNNDAKRTFPLRLC